MSQERGGQIGLENIHFQNRLARARERLFDKVWTKDFRKKTYTFHYRRDPETVRRLRSKTLAPEFGAVTVDEEGRLYLTRWQQGKIKPDYQILGMQPQLGRNYAENPPKTKTAKELKPLYYPKGIDVMLRGTERVQRLYQLIGGGDLPLSEASKTQAVVFRLIELEQCAANFKNLGEQDLKTIVEENLDFLEKNGFLNPQNPEKRRIKELLSRGFTDKHGRKNYLAAIGRIYGVAVACLKRQEAAVPSILRKYSEVVELTRLKRESTRAYLLAVSRVFDLVLQDPIFSNPDLRSKPREVWLSQARVTREYLSQLSKGLIDWITVRPYLIVARKVVEHLGARRLPEGTLSAKHQAGRTFWRNPDKRNTVRDYLIAGDFDKAEAAIRQCQKMIQKVLDVHADYESVKPSLRYKKSLR